MYFLFHRASCRRWIDPTLTDISLTQNAEEAAELKKKRTFRKFSYRGIDLDQ